MLQRNEILSSGIEVDRSWWYATKLVAVIAIAAVAAYVVHATLL